MVAEHWCCCCEGWQLNEATEARGAACAVSAAECDHTEPTLRLGIGLSLTHWSYAL